MILREATRDDLQPLLALCKKAWTRLGIPFDTNIDRLRQLREQRFRIIVLYDADAILAALIAYPIATDRGPGFEIKAFLVDQDLHDKTTLLDALSLYAMNIALAEGRAVVLSRRPRRTRGTVYGRDKLGMDTALSDANTIHQIGHAPDMMQHILDRHPQWQLP